MDGCHRRLLRGRDGLRRSRELPPRRGIALGLLRIYRAVRAIAERLVAGLLAATQIALA
jgi:hypothetical protein